MTHGYDGWRPGRARAGLTLVEVLVALTLVAIVALLAHQMLDVARRALASQAPAQDTHEQAMNADRWLAATFRSAVVTEHPDSAFQGAPEALRLTTWQRTGDGWFEPRTVRLLGTPGGLVAVTGCCDSLSLSPPLTAWRADYLTGIGGEALWLPNWSATTRLPTAVRLRSARAVGDTVVVDTAIYAIGRRG